MWQSVFCLFVDKNLIMGEVAAVIPIRKTFLFNTSLAILIFLLMKIVVTYLESNIL